MLPMRQHELDRRALEVAVQNAYGPINGIEKAADVDLHALLVTRRARAEQDDRQRTDRVRGIAPLGFGPAWGDTSPGPLMYALAACLGLGMGLATLAALVALWG